MVSVLFVTTHSVKVTSNNLPHSTPLQPHSIHVIIADLYEFLQTEHAWVCGTRQLLIRDSTQGFNKIHWKKKHVYKQQSHPMEHDQVISFPLKCACYAYLTTPTRSRYNTVCRLCIPIALVSSLVEPVKILSTATTTL